MPPRQQHRARAQTRRRQGQQRHQTIQHSQPMQAPTTGVGFINPYNFVRVACFNPHHASPRTHEKFAGLSGRITCVLENVTPLCLPDSEASHEFVIQSGPNQGNKRWRKEFSQLSDGTLYLPGSSIKGMLRSVAEAASNSCFTILTSDLAVFRDNRNYAVNHRRLGRLVKTGDDAWAMQDIHPDNGIPPASPQNPVNIWNERKRLYEEERANLFPDPNRHKPEPSNTEERYQRSGISFRWYDFLRGVFGDTERRDYDQNGDPLIIRRGRRIIQDRRPKDPQRREGEPVVIRWPVAEERVSPQHNLEPEAVDLYQRTVNSEAFRRFHNERVYLEDWQQQYLAPQDDEIYWYRHRRNSPNGKVCEFGRNFRYKWAYDPRDAVDPSHRPCSNPSDLCICCQMFGMVEERDETASTMQGEVNALVGKISISPARWIGGMRQLFWIDDHKILGTPKYSCRSFYLNSDSGSFNVEGDEYVRVVGGQVVPNPIRGRKFYWHHTKVCDPNWTEQQWQAYINRRDKPDGARSPETDQNAQLQALMPGARFEFTIDFENLTSWQLGLLLWSLALPDVPNGAHHLGLGKPIGLGSTVLRIRRIQLIDRGRRYASMFATGVATDVEADPQDQNAVVDVSIPPFGDYIGAFRSQMEAWSSGTPFLDLPNIADLLIILSQDQPAQATLPPHLPGASADAVPITYPPGPDVPTNPEDPHPEELHHNWFGTKGRKWAERLLTIQEIARGCRQTRA
jgi:CRISPR-associated protein (TIGR03986 family)